jgi:hypothetical protein
MEALRAYAGVTPTTTGSEKCGAKTIIRGDTTNLRSCASDVAFTRVEIDVKTSRLAVDVSIASSVINVHKQDNRVYADITT